MPESPIFRAVETSGRGAGLPYGYAITVWATGSALFGEHGKASPGSIYLFAGGAVVAYGLLKLLTWETQQEAEKPLPRSPHPVRAGIMHIAAIAVAIGAALAAAQIHGEVAWFVAPFLATLLYLSGSSVEVALVEEDEQG